MPTFKTWDIVKVPFPYTDRPVRQYRPAPVVAAGELAAAHGLLWVLMITSAENRQWDDDVAILAQRIMDGAGRSAASTLEIATIETRDAERLGSLPAANRKQAAAHLARALAATASARP